MKLQILAAVVSTTTAIIGILNPSQPTLKLFLLFLAVASGITSAVLSYQTNKDTEYIKRLLNNLVLSIKPSEQVILEIAERVPKIAYNSGHEYTLATTYGKGGLEFTMSEDEEHNNLTGYLFLAPEEIAKLSMYWGDEFETKLKESIFEKWAFSIENDIRDEIFCDKLICIISNRIKLYLPAVGTGSDVRISAEGNKHLLIFPIIKNNDQEEYANPLMINYSELQDILKMPRVIIGASLANLVAKEYAN